MGRVTQFVIRVKNKPGVLAQICTELAKVAVNITGIMASQKARQGIPMVVEPHTTAAKVLDTLKIPYGEEQGLEGRPGANRKRRPAFTIIQETHADSTAGRPTWGQVCGG